MIKGINIYDNIFEPGTLIQRSVGKDKIECYWKSSKDDDFQEWLNEYLNMGYRIRNGFKYYIQEIKKEKIVNIIAIHFDMGEVQEYEYNDEIKKYNFAQCTIKGSKKRGEFGFEISEKDGRFYVSVMVWKKFKTIKNIKFKDIYIKNDNNYELIFIDKNDSLIKFSSQSHVKISELKDKLSKIHNKTVYITVEDKGNIYGIQKGNRTEVEKQDDYFYLEMEWDTYKLTLEEMEKMKNEIDRL